MGLIQTQPASSLRAAPMKSIGTFFLQATIVALGAGILAFLLWEPQIEGLNANATQFEIYFNPFILFAYAASVPFFVGLYQTFKPAGNVRQNQLVSPNALKALRTIKYCAMALLGCIVCSLAFMIQADQEDRPAGAFMRLLIALPSILTAIAATALIRILQKCRHHPPSITPPPEQM